MPTSARIIRNTYRDSVSLMQVSAKIAALAGIRQASVVMATPGNLAMLREAGLLDTPLEASPSDLLAVVQGEDENDVQAALAQVEPALSGAVNRSARRGPQTIAPRTLRMGLEAQPGANLALISTPGDYAAAEALKALRLGLNVMLFSDNVAVSEEVLLKREAAERGLLVMGPDCGTAIIGGIPLGFANAVRRGAIGVVGASGTGVQQVTSLVDQMGLGISHAIGTGGHDLSAEVGGASMLQGIDALVQDEHTRVIVLISKPPVPVVASTVLQRARGAGKPVVACFLGSPGRDVEGGNVVAAATLEQAATLAAEALRRCSSGFAVNDSLDAGAPDLRAAAAPRLAPGQRFVRGLYSGGTFCFEATLLLSQALKGVHSNTVTGSATALEDAWTSRGHTLVDLGDDQFTRGRPHPMIDHRLRNERILREAADPEVAIILLDVVLGYGSHPDPAAAMLPAIREARAIARKAGREIIIAGFVCGTESDPQVLSRQCTALQSEGMLLSRSSARAARFAAELVSGRD